MKGSKDAFLQNPNSVVLTRSTANTCFQDQNPLGKTIQLGDNVYTVTGIVDDWPANAHFHPKFIATFGSFPAHDDKSWNNFNTRTYFLLNEGASINSLKKKLPTLLEHHVQKNADTASMRFTYTPQALTDIHLYSNLEGELEQNGQISTIYIVLSIALLILLNACINYINLSTARARKRIREVGIRKTFGAGRKKLIFQFLGETYLITGVSFLFSLIVIEACLPLFNQLFHQELNFDMLFNPVTISIFIGILVITGALAGFYPAFYLTSFSVEEVLKGRIQSKNKFTFSLGRKGMIIFQFLISISLIASSLVIIRQLNFIKNKDLGFDKKNLIVIPLGTEGERGSFNFLKSKIISNPDIQGVTSAVNYPGRGYINQRHWFSETAEKSILTQMGFVVPHFLELFDINLIKGKDFYEQNHNRETHSVIINETAAKRFGLGDHPIGKKISRSSPDTKDRTFYKVIGVTEDFNTQSLREPIQPVVLYRVDFNVNMIARVAPGATEKTIDFIRTTFKKINPYASFEYSFVNDFLANYYRADNNYLKILVSFTVLAIFIAGMGLLGLVGYFIQDKSKELALRKVMEASKTDIVALLSKDFIILVALGFVLSVPVAWYIMSRWLQDFAYRIEIGPGIFALAGGIAVLIALVTLSWQSMRAALTNPVESLRNE